ncbi:hypothetical protein [Paractinoplanes atraurantiacus]|uniref:hypothetical protein n=1 Tax=Paractinoplanes atraurantiacus TaxID=1036182 RepID=UPI0015CF2560|nr:hypothetical protein [Actinoplanes atraurantiacus]
MNDEVGACKPAILTGIVLAGLAVLSWETHDTPVPTSTETAAAPHLTTLGVGALVLALHLFLLHRCRHTTNRAVLTATATLAVLICTALLVTGHQAQRMRSPKHESLDSLLLRGRPAAVSYEPASAHVVPSPHNTPHPRRSGATRASRHQRADRTPETETAPAVGEHLPNSPLSLSSDSSSRFRLAPFVVAEQAHC